MKQKEAHSPLKPTKKYKKRKKIFETDHVATSVVSVEQKKRVRGLPKGQRMKKK